MQTIITLPQPIQRAIATLLADAGSNAWMKRAQLLHQRYRQQEENKQQIHVVDALDALAYLGLRASATYSQIWGAVDAICDLVPGWQPTTLLDLGCGAGSGLWALTDLLPSLTQATAVDQSAHFLQVGQQIFKAAQQPLTVTWQQANILQSVQQGPATYDVVLLANVLNEVNEEQRTRLVEAAFKRCNAILIIVEPGTPVGSRVVQQVAHQLAPVGTLLAPYLGTQFVREEWLHFPQRFTRPDFARRLRQEMRESDLMASDWEEAKYSYVAIGKLPPAVMPWARVIGPTQLKQGYIEVPLLTATGRLQAKVFKRYKPAYAYAKKLHWGEAVQQRTDLLPSNEP
jgi:ribosomal protein RSM22 (predicted rRNA methylase)